jgi:hypothetical protein
MIVGPHPQGPRAVRLRHLRRAAIVCVMVLTAAAPAAAQTLGTFTWQLLPFCNALTVTVAQIGGVFSFHGWDDQCGAGERVPVSGLAVPAADGSIAVGVTGITAGGAPVHLSAQLQLPAASGTWRDSSGNSGAFALGRTASAGGPRPLTGLGGAGVDPRQVQARVTGTCGAGEFMTGIAQDGSVACAPFPTASFTGATCPPATHVQGVDGDGRLVCAAAGTGAPLACPAFEAAVVVPWVVTAGTSVTAAVCAALQFQGDPLPYGLGLEIRTAAGHVITARANGFRPNSTFPRLSLSCRTDAQEPCPGLADTLVATPTSADVVACRQEIVAWAGLHGATCP